MRTDDSPPFITINPSGNFIKKDDVRKEFINKLHTIPYLHVMPTQANFVLCEVLPPFTANGLALSLLKNDNNLVSACSAKKGIEPDRYVRFAIRSASDNQRLIRALLNLA